MNGNCNIITEIFLVIITLLVTAKSNIITVTKLLVTSYCPTPDLIKLGWRPTDLISKIMTYHLFLFNEKSIAYCN